MMQRIWHWWPVLPACIILYLGAVSFMEKLPKDSYSSLEKASSQGTTDSVLEFIQTEHNKSSMQSPSSDSVTDSDPTGKNPFRSARGPSTAGERVHPGIKTDPPWRKYVLKGTVGNQVATIADRNGRKLILKVGDQVDSATVESIETNRVILKDRAGKFEILQE
jgi:hypothetical protein